jgi:hypothetical protein
MTFRGSGGPGGGVRFFEVGTSSRLMPRTSIVKVPNWLVTFRPVGITTGDPPVNA